MFFQWIFCVAVWIAALILNAVRHFPTFYPLCMLGGVFWATGNAFVVPIMKTLGMGLGLLLWGTVQLLIGWASGKWGWFGIGAERTKSPTLNYIGVILAALSAVIFIFVKPSEHASESRAEITHPDQEGLPESHIEPDERDPLLPKVNDPSLQTQEHNRNTHHKEIFTDHFSAMQKRIFGVVMSIISGILYGFMFIPTLYVKKHMSGASQEDIDHVFAHFSGILCTSTLYFLIYCVVKKNKPDVFPSAILPAYISGSMWAVGMISYFLANSNLNLVISVPIISIGPGVIGSLWGVFFFKEIQGIRNYIVLIVAFIFTITSAVITSQSK